MKDKSGVLQAWVGSVREGCAATVDANRDTTDQVAHSYGDSSPKQSKSSVVVLCRVQGISINGRKLCGEYDRHDHAVDGDDFAEDDRDEILRSYPWCLNTSS